MICIFIHMVAVMEATSLQRNMKMNPIVITSFKRVKSPDEVVMDFELSQSYKDKWSGEREWGSSILGNMKRVGLSFKLYKLTRGNGSCLMIAVLQQLKRPELYSKLTDPMKQMVNNLDYQTFRWFVKKNAEAFKVSYVSLFLPLNNQFSYF